MKKVLFLLIAVLGLTFAVNAQDNNLGVRLGGGQGFNAELSWQHMLGGNRMELDLGYANFNDASSLSVNAIYQFLFDLGHNFNWYVGPGAHVGIATVNNDVNVDLALAGQVGIEHNFAAIPLQLSLDIRPRFYLVPSTNFHWGDIALGIRYRF